MEYEIKKDKFFGGGTRTLKFIKDQSIKDVIMLPSGKQCSIKVPQGLPNTTSKKKFNSKFFLYFYCKIGPNPNYYQKNFESENWWPKFEQLKKRFNITIVKGDRSRPRQAKNNVTKIGNQPKLVSLVKIKNYFLNFFF